MVQSVKHPTLGFGSGNDLTFMSSSPALGSALVAQSLLGILSLPHSALPPLTRKEGGKERKKLRKVRKQIIHY